MLRFSGIKIKRALACAVLSQVGPKSESGYGYSGYSGYGYRYDSYYSDSGNS